MRGWKLTEWGDEQPVDVPLAEAMPEDFDALLLPGGVINPDKLRMDPDAVDFVSVSSMPTSRWPRSATGRGR